MSPAIRTYAVVYRLWNTFAKRHVIYVSLHKRVGNVMSSATGCLQIPKLTLWTVE